MANAKSFVMSCLVLIPLTLTALCAQILDNAVISAGILDDVREMLPRLSQLMKAAIDR